MIAALGIRALVAAINLASPLATALDHDVYAGRYLSADEAAVHALAATLAETPDASRYVMTSLAARESHFVATSGPRGHWPTDPARMPRNLRHWIAGPCQTTETSIADAVAVREPIAGYRSCAEQLGAWAAACRRWGRGGLACSLAGFATGTRAARSGDRTHVDDVLVRARRLERAARFHVEQGGRI